MSCPFWLVKIHKIAIQSSTRRRQVSQKIGYLFVNIPNIFGIADDILIADFDGKHKDHDYTFDKVLQICRQASMKLNKDKCLFRCTSIPFFGEVVSCKGVSPDPRKI